MKNIFFLIAILATYITSAQENTNIYVFDIALAYEGLEVFNKKTISENEGYNNQPSFANNEILYYSGNNNGQSDIAEYNLKTGDRTWFNTATPGGEYSPQRFPSSKSVAAGRLDPDDKQRLYKYDKESGTSTEIIKDLNVAYFSFYSDDIILATVLDGNEMDLGIIDLKNKNFNVLFNKAGRSLQRIPKTDYMSYTLINEVGKLDLYMMNINSSESYFICEIPMEIQDYVWISDTQIVVGKNEKLYMYDTLGEGEWTMVSSLKEHGIKNVMRMAISPNGKKLAVVDAK